MPQTTDALIIREYNNIGEADRFVAALTRDLGPVSYTHLAGRIQRWICEWF